MDVDLEWEGDSPEDAARKMVKFGAVLPGHLEDAMNDIGVRMIGTAERLVNVDTGRLQSSLSHEVERLSWNIVRVILGSNVEYAPFQEMDYPFLRPAIEEHLDYAEDRILQAVEDAAEEAA